MDGTLFDRSRLFVVTRRSRRWPVTALLAGPSDECASTAFTRARPRERRRMRPATATSWCQHRPTDRPTANPLGLAGEAPRDAGAPRTSSRWRDDCINVIDRPRTRAPTLSGRRGEGRRGWWWWWWWWFFTRLRLNETERRRRRNTVAGLVLTRSSGFYLASCSPLCTHDTPFKRRDALPRTVEKSTAVLSFLFFFFFNNKFRYINLTNFDYVN